MQVRYGGHDLGVGIGVVVRRGTAREGRGRPERAAGRRVAEMGYGGTSFILSGGVGNCHVGFGDGNVVLW